MSQRFYTHYITSLRIKQLFGVSLSPFLITYNKYTVKGPLKTFETAGADLFGLEDCEHTFIDTEGGVTFLFEENNKNGGLEAYQICKYYDIHKQDKITTA